MRTSAIKFAQRAGMVMLIGLLPAVIVTVAEVEHFQSSTGQPVNGGVFDGNLPGLGQVRFDVFFNESNVTGWLYREDAGSSDWVSLKLQPSGMIHAKLLTGDGEWATNGTMDFRITQATGRLEGSITLISNRPPRPFALTCVYEHRAIGRRSGPVLGRFGAAADFSGQIPVLKPTCAFHIKLSKEIAKETASAAAHYTVRDWGEVWHDLRGDRAPIGLHVKQYWQLRLLTNSLASFGIWSDLQYEGGCGDPIRWSSKNYIWRDGKLHEFKIADLFRDGSGWEAELRRLCSQDLMDRDKPTPAADVTDPDVELNTFTLSSTGLQIYVNPYEISSGADGDFVFNLPYAQLQPFLKTNGPATYLTHLTAPR